MSNTAAAVVDRVLPDVPVRQYVLSLPWELRLLAAVKAPVLTALGRIFVDAIFASYRGRARRRGLRAAQCGAINFVQRFGSSLNLNIHFHVVVLDGVWTRSAGQGVRFHAAAVPSQVELVAIVERVRARALAWLKRNGHIDESPEEERSQEFGEQTALEACTAIAMARGRTLTLGADREANDHGTGRPGLDDAVESDGFNLHAGVSIAAGDDEGREKLCRYAARPAVSMQRFRRLRGGLVAYHLKYVRGPRAKHRIMDIVPKPRGAPPPCKPPTPSERRIGARAGARSERAPPAAPKTPEHHLRSGHAAVGASVQAGDVERLAANVLSVRHWDRLLGGVLYAATPRMDWARLLRRSLGVDVLKCPKCDGRLRVIAAITEAASVARILAHIGVPTEAPAVARARDPTDDVEGDGGEVQFELAFG
jgi:hypothetical protein